MPADFELTGAGLCAVHTQFAVFWGFLFVAAYRLPGGAAATLCALQPLIMMFLVRSWLAQPVHPVSFVAPLFGVAGVAMKLVGPDPADDLLGVAAALLAMISMAARTVLSRNWRPDVPVLAFTAWQLTADGLLLSGAAIVLEPPLPSLSITNTAGLLWLGLVGAALTYGLWLRGIARLDAQNVALLGMISPIVAVGLGWVFLDEALGPLQVIGAGIVLVSIGFGQRRA